MGALTLLLLFLAACGSDVKAPTGGTPAGTFSIGVTGTAGAVQTNATITLNVQ